MSNNFSYNIHDSFMARALELAKKGRGYVSPNPLVGCILVKNGEIIGEGFHEKYGDSHAEVMAYKNSIKDPGDSTMYVTLEPCCFEGKTSACTQFIKENGIREVYVGMKDPNPKVCGQGIKELQDYGIKIHVGLLREECEELNKGYIKLISTKRPWVIAKVAQSEDEFLGFDSNSRTKISGKEANIHCHSLRSKVDAIMVGSQTALVDNPMLTVREVEGKNPVRVIVDTNRKLPLTLNVFTDYKADTIVLCSDNKFENNKTSFAKYLSIKENNDGNLCPENMLNVLGSEGICTILIEGGVKLLNSFKDLDLIDEVYIYTSNKKLVNATLENPLKIDDRWDVKDQKSLGADSLLVAKRKVECLQVS